MAMRMNPYLVTNGNGREAVAFYAQALEAEVLSMQTFGEVHGEEIPASMKDGIMHAHLKVGATDLMLSDTMPDQPHEVGNHVTIALHVNNAATANRVFTALSADGDVIMPLQETFWSPAYGQVVDQFGVHWQLTTDPASA